MSSVSSNMSLANGLNVSANYDSVSNKTTEILYNSTGELKISHTSIGNTVDSDIKDLQFQRGEAAGHNGGKITADTDSSGIINWLTKIFSKSADASPADNEPSARSLPASKENTSNAAQTLLNDPQVPGGDKPMTRDDLKDIAKDTSLSPDTRKAAQYLLDHPAEFGKVESADDHGKRDGIISKQGMEAYLNKGGTDSTSKNPPSLPASKDNTSNAAQTLLNDPQVPGGDKPMTRDDLKDIAQDTSLSPDTRKAAQYLLDHPAEFGKVEGADDHGKRDGIISKQGMEAYLNKTDSNATGGSAPASKQNTLDAAQTLLNDPNIPDGDTPMTRADLKDIAKDTSYSPETRKAAQYLLNHPAEFGKVEGADDNGKTDGIISKQGMAAYVNNDDNSNFRPQASKENTLLAAQTLLNDPKVPGGDKPMTRDDLKDIAKDSSVSPDTRMAAQYLLDHPAEFGKVEGADDNGKTDGIISKQGMAAYVDKEDDSNYKPEASKENTLYAAQTLLNDPKVPGGDKPMTRDDLQDIAQDASFSPDTRMAAQYLLDHSAEFGKVEGADDNGKTDGIISKQGMAAYVNSDDNSNFRPQASKENTLLAAQTLLNDPKVPGGDKPMTRDDLKGIAKDSSVSPDTRMAAQYLLDHPDEFGKVEGADDNGKTDGIISKQGMAAYVNNDDNSNFRPQASKENTLLAAQTLLNDPKVPGGDKPMTRDDLKGIAKDSSVSPDTRMAAQYLLDHPAEFGKVEGADDNGKTDGIISKQGMAAYVNNDDNSNFRPAASKENTQYAAQTLLDDPKVPGGDKPMTRADLKDIAKDSSYSPDTRMAAQYLLDHSAEFGKVESADDHGKTDGIISKQGMEAYLNKPSIVIT